MVMMHVKIYLKNQSNQDFSIKEKTKTNNNNKILEEFGENPNNRRDQSKRRTVCNKIG